MKNPPLIPNQRLKLSPVPDRLQSHQLRRSTLTTHLLQETSAREYGQVLQRGLKTCTIESTGNAYISRTMNVIGDILSSTGNISTTSGNMSAGSSSTTGTGNFDGYVRCKSGLNIGDPAESPTRCSISSTGDITSQTTYMLKVI